MSRPPRRKKAWQSQEEAGGIHRLQHGARDLDQRTGQVSGAGARSSPYLAQVYRGGGHFRTVYRVGSWGHTHTSSPI